MLTKTAIDRLTYDPSGPNTQVLWDSAAKGQSQFGVRVLPSGRKSFIWRHGKRYKTLGKYGDITLEEARKKARALYGRLRDGEEVFRRKAEISTVADLAENYMKIHGSKKRSAHKDRQLIDNYLVPKLGKRIATEIKRADIARFHDEISQKYPIAANRALALVSKIWTLSERRGYLPEGHPNPAKGVERNPENGRRRYVKADEMPKLAAAIREEEDVSVKALFWFLLLTGCRKSQARYAAWEELEEIEVAVEPKSEDLPQSEVTTVTLWHIPAERCKNKKPHTIPLPALAVEVLRHVPRRAGGGLIFRGGCADGSIEMDGEWDDILSRAGLEDLRIHDLRHTTISLMVQKGVSLAIAGEAAGHSAPSVTAGYAHHAMDPVREALEKVGSLLQGHVLSSL